VNGDGFALYLYKKDTQNGQSSACTDEECTTDWIPLTSEGSPIAGEGAIQKLLGTITREDGKEQVTYNGWPLYLYGAEQEAGSIAGQGMDGEWFLVSPAGIAILK
jgi:predicted lipoprotein with Yx(FWY)xxD motif